MAEQDKSLEDKADNIMQHLEDMKTSAKATTSKTRQPMLPLLPLPGNELGQSNKLMVPEQAVPFAQYLSSTKSETVAPFYFLISSIALVMLVMVRYVLTRRRAHSVFRTSFRL